MKLVRISNILLKLKPAENTSGTKTLPSVEKLLKKFIYGFRLAFLLLNLDTSVNTLRHNWDLLRSSLKGSEEKTKLVKPFLSRPYILLFLGQFIASLVCLRRKQKQQLSSDPLTSGCHSRRFIGSNTPPPPNIRT